MPNHVSGSMVVGTNVTSSCLCKKLEGAGLPFQVKAIEDGMFGYGVDHPLFVHGYRRHVCSGQVAAALNALPTLSLTLKVQLSLGVTLGTVVTTQ